MLRGQALLPRQAEASSISKINSYSRGTSLVVQWLRLYTSTAGVTGSIAGQGTKILNATQPKKLKKKKKIVTARMQSEKNLIFE